MISLRPAGALLLFSLFLGPPSVLAAPASFDIDLKELDRQQPAPSQKPVKKKVKKVPRSTAAAKHGSKRQASAAEDSAYARYTVRPGDHVFKILMVRFGMSNEAAERLIPEVARVNHIANIKRLTVGDTLLIPGKGRHESPARSAQRGRAPREKASPPAAVLENEALLDARDGVASPQQEDAPVAAISPDELETPPGPAPLASTSAAPAPSVAPPVAVALPVIVSAPSFPAATTWICSVTGQDSAGVVDAVLNALSVSWQKNRIVQSDETAPTAFSIRVDRYFEYKGARCIVSFGGSDPYSYTLLRMLENVGYRVLRISGSEDFRAAGEKLLGLIGVEPDFGRHALQETKESTGFLVQQDDAGGRRVLITGEPVDPGQKWVMARGCGSVR